MAEKKWTRRILTVKIGGDGRPKELQGREPWDPEAEDEQRILEEKNIVTVHGDGSITGEPVIKAHGRRDQRSREDLVMPPHLVTVHGGEVTGEPVIEDTEPRRVIIDKTRGTVEGVDNE